ncbi:hypothetical protein PSTG_09479 [Puccinia striiformis f. sp. tritici PST-78]|uniref:Uncharacterized protein n=1 Tax=Puccinia striiformis f. sp. tritici PST-78 TaxID=1165861 RepID=A0A0L0VD52_9BASI|nr:hypothetical protein PSTG_09479 [Puccinia striiformis f. sp. tritici PST-78]
MAEATNREEETSEQWKDLLGWLESEQTNTGEFKATIQASSHSGRILVAKEDIHEATPILSLPRSVLLDTQTIPSEFIERYGQGLNSIQTLTLYLTIYSGQKRLKNSSTIDYYLPFESYLNTLPQDVLDFQGVPLIWQLNITYKKQLNQIKLNEIHTLNKNRSDNQDDQYPVKNGQFKCYELMTWTTIKQADEVLDRFVKDWTILNHTKPSHPSFHDCRLSDLAWAWLIVNTRCVSFDIGAKDHDNNITLAPGFDMANHCSSSKVTTIVNRKGITMYSSDPTETTNHSKPIIKKGEEIKFKYGPHSNSTLLTEYGFVDSHHINPWDHIDISPLIISLFDPDNLAHQNKIDLLKVTGYWEDYTIQNNPLEISHRVPVALRLLYTPENKIPEWQDHIDGLIDHLQDSVVEELVHSTVLQFIQSLLIQSQSLVDHLNTFNLGQDLQTDEFGFDTLYSFNCLKTLAINQLHSLSSYNPSHK